MVSKVVQELVPVVIVPKQLRQWSLLSGDSLGVWGLLIFSGDTGKEGGEVKAREVEVSGIPQILIA